MCKWEQMGRWRSAHACTRRQATSTLRSTMHVQTVQSRYPCAQKIYIAKHEMNSPCRVTQSLVVPAKDNSNEDLTFRYNVTSTLIGSLGLGTQRFRIVNNFVRPHLWSTTRTYRIDLRYAQNYATPLI